MQGFLMHLKVLERLHISSVFSDANFVQHKIRCTKITSNALFKFLSLSFSLFLEFQDLLTMAQRLQMINYYFSLTC